MNLDFLKPKSQPLIGVDISTSAVKIVELSGSKRYLTLERFAVEPLPRSAISDGNIVDTEAIGEAIRKAWRASGSRVKNVAIALPSAAVITKKIILPETRTESELEMQVSMEAYQHIPFSADEVNLDFQILGPAPASPGEIEVLITAAKKEKVDDRIAAVESAGLKPVVLDVESFAGQAAFELIEGQLPRQGSETISAIIDIGAATTHINVVKGSQQIYFREQAFGGNQLSTEIQRKFNLSPEEAEVAKRNGGLPDNYVMEILQPFMESVASEVARAIQFFFTSTQYNHIHNIILSGGCSAIKRLNEVVAERTNITTVVANPFANMSHASRVKTRQLLAIAPTLMIACGLALRRFDP